MRTRIAFPGPVHDREPVVGLTQTIAIEPGAESQAIHRDQWAFDFFPFPDTYQVQRQLTVRNGGRRVGHLNELEYVNGHILANIWHRDYIVSILPKDGSVVARIDLRGLLPGRPRFNREAVLNGIAYDAEADTFLVTGKRWPELIEIRVSDPLD